MEILNRNQANERVAGIDTAVVPYSVTNHIVASVLHYLLSREESLGSMLNLTNEELTQLKAAFNKLRNSVGYPGGIATLNEHGELPRLQLPVLVFRFDGFQSMGKVRQEGLLWAPSDCDIYFDQSKGMFFLRTGGVLLPSDYISWGSNNDCEIPSSADFGPDRSSLYICNNELYIWTGKRLRKIAGFEGGTHIYGHSELQSLTDVDLYNLQPGDALVYDGVGWTNQAIQAGLDETKLGFYLSSHNYAKKSDIIIPDLSGYATETWVKEQGYLSSHQSLAGYATEAWVKEQGYLSSHQSLAGYATENWVEEKGYALNSSLTSHTGNATVHITAAERTKWDNKVDTVAGMGLSANDFTDALLSKLNGIEAGANKYIHPTATATTISAASGKVLSAITVNGLGHVTSVSSKTLAAADIPNLDWIKITSGKPSTLAGYGITDAKIDGGVVTLGASSITPLVSADMKTLSFKSGTFTAKTYSPTSAQTVNVPTKTSHLTNDSDFTTNALLASELALKADKEAFDTLKTWVEEMFGLEKDSNSPQGKRIKAKYGLYTPYYLSARGLNPDGGSSGGGGVSGLMRNWLQSEDENGSTNLALGANLGWELKKMIENLPATSVNPFALTIQKNGTAIDSYDGSSAKTINISDVASASTLTSHTGNTTAHITAAERTKWNKASTDLSTILGTDSDTIINKFEEIVAFLDTYTEADTLANLLSNKVDKVDGKGLSANDFTDALLSKLNGIEAGANKYVHPTATATTISAASGKVLSAITVNGLGHVTSVSSKTLAAADIPSLDWSKITTGKPTTLSGYGISDAYTKNEAGNLFVNVSGDTMTGLLTLNAGAKVAGGQKLVIGDCEITWDAAKGGLKFSKGIFSEGFVSARGADSSSGGSSGGGVSYDRLDKWTDYTDDKKGYVLSAELGYDLYMNKLSSITKAMVEGVLTGDIATHTHSQYLTGHQSLANYVTLNTSQTITGAKTFKGELTIGTQTINTTTAISIGSSIGNANYDKYHRIDLGYHSYDRINIYEAAVNFFSNGGTTAHTIIKADSLTAPKFVKSGGTSSQFLKADGSVDSNTYLTTGSASSTYLPKSSYTAADVLAKLLTVDGTDSGLDADLLDGKHNGEVTALTLAFPAYGSSNPNDNSNLAIIKEHYTKLPVKTPCAIQLTHGSASMAFGWRLGAQYNSVDKAYCGWFISDYNTPRWIGASNGTWISETFAFISSNVASASKLETSRYLWGNSFDGTEDISGGLSFGDVAAGSTSALLSVKMASNDYFRLLVGGAANAGYVELATADDGNEPIYVRQYSGVFATLKRTAALLDGSGNTSFPGQVTAGSLKIGDCVITYENGGLKFSKGIFSEGFVSARGADSSSGGSSGGGVSYDRLNKWSDYTDDKKGYVLSAELGYDLYQNKLSAITKSMVEAVLTGNITTHTHSQYLTGHQSLANYVTLNTAQTITGVKTFGSDKLKFSAGANYTYLFCSTNTNIPTAGKDYSWQWYHAAEASGFRGLALWSYDGDGKVYNQVARFEAHDGNKFVMVGAVHGGSFVKSDGTSSQFLKADGSVDSTSYLSRSGGSMANTNVVTNLNADLLDGWHAEGQTGFSIKKSGYVSSGTASLSSYWGKLATINVTAAENKDITLYLHTAQNGLYGILNINIRINSGSEVYSMKLITGNIPYDRIRLYKAASSPRVFELWVDVAAQWGAMNAMVLSETNRTGTEAGTWVTMHKNDFTAVQAPTLASYITPLYLDLNNNTASASRLFNSRNIWGQPFNGTANVSGRFELNGAASGSLSIYEETGYKVIQTWGGKPLILNPLGNGVGIGKTAPEHLFDVGGAAGVDSLNSRGGITIGNADNNGSLEIWHSTPYIDFHFGRSASDYTTRLIEEASGRLAVIGTLRVSVGMYSNGYISAKGQNTSSDARLKRILSKMEMSVEQVAAAPSVLFRWRDDSKEDLGSVAQYWRKISPLLTPENPEGMLTLQYGKAALLAAISIAKETVSHREEIKALKERVKQLETEIEKMR